MEEQLTREINRTVLLVDDEADILTIWKELLELYGYSVITAANGEEAIDKYSAVDIGLVILDIGMPGMGGLRCLEKLLSIDENAKVLMISGYASENHMYRALQSGAKAFLSKPYSNRNLLVAVEEMFE